MSLERRLPLILLVVAAASIAWLIAQRLLPGGGQQASRTSETRIVPVEVTPVERGTVVLRRTFTGTLDAHAEFVVAPKLGGRIDEVSVDISDTVTRGQVVARLDNAEYVQAVTRAEADLAVARANLAEARSQLTIAERELQRLDQLRKRGVSSESQRDLAKADQLAKEAHVQVSRAQVTRARAELETARIRLGYTRISADWTGGSDQRLVAERYLDEGETVAANAPLLRIVELDPLTAVFFVTERDYALLGTGQQAELRTDSYPGEIFPGEIARIAPVFRSSTRQARVEVRLENSGLRLKPGMFVRVTLSLGRAEDATVVPEQALVTRDGQTGVFLVDAAGGSVRWHPVETGIREGERVQVIGEGIGGRVVTLGQQLLDDGSRVAIAGASGVVSP